MTEQLCDTCIYAKKADIATPMPLFKWVIGLLVGFMLTFCGWVQWTQGNFKTETEKDVKESAALIKENKEILIELRANQVFIKSELEKLRVNRK